jgi:predicted metal-dependent phosphoesterase TrpH
MLYALCDFLINMEGLFHVHSNYSADGRLSLEELRKECLKRNLQFMVVTDHAEDFPPGKAKKFIDHCKKVSDSDFLVVPGLEFNIDREREVHLLVVGLDGLPCENEPEAILKKVREGKNSALNVVAHLSRSNHYIPPEYEDKINGIEIWNAAYNSRYLPDQKAMRLFTNLKKKNSQLVGFGGLDLHDRSGFRELKICLTNSCHNEKELLDDLKAGKFKIRGQYMSLSSQPTSGFWLMTILGLGRKVLVAADFIRWKAITIVRACRVLK